MHIRMFANELLLKNDSDVDREYRIEKADKDSVGIEEVTANDRSVGWQQSGVSVFFTCTIPPGKEVLLRIRYTPPARNSDLHKHLSRSLRVATRRYLCEFRDNFLCRHDGLRTLAKRTTAFVSRR